nr:hypothetical protein CPGR_00815 [Mycolicibacterium fortuitum subsp. fortuitum DSM 46621 = ATCC 6841 = JCM 6387]CRL80077.1 hypothetical protein CPGR_03273 [Mycolicibacter nonchromogenicus]
MLPGRQEATVGRSADRLHLRTQRSQGTSTQDPQDFGVAPLITGQIIDELAAHQSTVDGHATQNICGHPQPQPEPGSQLCGGERPVRAGIAADQVPERVVDGFGECRRYSDRNRGADPVA